MKKRYLSLLLIIAMFFSLFSMSSISAEPSESETLPLKEEAVVAPVEKTVEASKVPENIRKLIADQEAETIFLDSGTKDEAELFTLRTENPETGEGTLIVHAVPIKYIDDDGEMQFIDTSMKALTAKEKAQSGFSYRNAANDFSVEYGDTASKGVKFNDAFTFKVASETAVNKVGRIQTEKGQGKIAYSDAFGANTTVEYINTESGIKENIILDKYTGQTRFEFVFQSDTHIPVLGENGMYILVVNKNNPKEAEYRFLPLYAYDAYKPEEAAAKTASDFRHLNEELYYDLTNNADGTYTITVVVPKEYLTHPEVVYPVTIDPTVIQVSDTSNVQDTFVNAAAPNTQIYSTYNYIRFGKVGGYKNFGYIRFTRLPTLPAGAIINSASLKFTFRSGQNTPAASSGIKFGAYRVSDFQWNATTITWENQPFGHYGVSTPITYTNGYLDYCDADITAMVAAWYSGTPNYGMDFTYSNEEYNDYNSVVSSEGEAHRAPYLTIKYTEFWPVTPKPTIYSRSEWGARDPVVSQYDARTQAPQRIIFHHSAEKFSETGIDAVKSEIRRIQDLHMGSNRNWEDIGYNFIVDPAGRIWEGHTLSYKGCHTYGYNNDIGVLILGDFEPRAANLWNANTLNDQQKGALKTLSKWLCREYRLSKISTSPNYAPISTHRTYEDTDCPGANAAPWIEGTLRTYINDWGA